MKSLTLFIAFLLFVSLISPIHGILDQDGDGMSDLWEPQYGFSVTTQPIPAQAPAADPDGDGVTNLLESIAGTDPLSTAAPLGVHQLTSVVNPVNPLSHDLHWQQFIGKQYQVLTSDSLGAGTWTPLASPYIATLANLGAITTAPITAASPKKFYRVSVVDVDPDSDDLTNWEESILGTNPLLADSDGDGKSDKAEVLQGSSPDDASDNGLAPAQPELLPMKLRIFTYASLATDYVNGGINGLLTPYRIKIYQQNLLTGVETLVHTTPDYGGSAFSLTNTVDLPNISNDPTRRYTAQIDLPTIGTNAFSPPYRRWSFFLTISASVGSAPFVGVNGLEPITQTFSNAGHILRILSPYDILYKDYRAVIEPLEMTWKPIVGFDNVGGHVDPWTLPIAGSRIFPDFKNPLDTIIRHKLELVVKTSVALAGKTVFVKSFDVDDSTSEAFDTTDGAAPSVDTNGKSGNDNLPDYLGTPQSGQFWTGSAWAGDTAQGIVDANGETKFIFRVGMQPGNNYRVVASLVEPSMINGIQVTASTAPKYLGPAFAQNAGVSASPLLTVWRRLWVENDSMAAIPVDPFGYKRNDLSWNLSVPTVRNVLFDSAAANTSFVIDAITDQSSFSNLENGRMIVQSIVHPVIGTAPFSVTVAGDQSSVPVNSGFRLYDDDEFGLVVPSLPRTDIVHQQMKDYFKPAFIEITNAGGFNLDKIVPFKINDDLQGSTLVNSKKDLTEKDALWVAQITVAYQFDSSEDGDPNDGLQTDGGTRKFENYDHSTVFVESCRETYDTDFRLSANGGNPIHSINARINLKNYINAQASHEIGHQPGDDLVDEHTEGGLMRGGGSNPLTPLLEKFSPTSILRFRKSKNWSKK